LEARLYFFDARSHNSHILNTFNESHGDDITQIKFHPTNPAKLMSASMDGLVCMYDLTTMDEDEAITFVANSKSSVHKIGYFGPDSEFMYCLNHMETFSLWTVDTNGTGEAEVIQEFGDIRRVSKPEIGFSLDYAIDCQYDPVTQRLFLFTGSNE
jgi:WD40 repeat protein